MSNPKDPIRPRTTAEVAKVAEVAQKMLSMMEVVYGPRQARTSRRSDQDVGVEVVRQTLEGLAASLDEPVATPQVGENGETYFAY